MGIEERKIREKKERHRLILGKAKELILEKGVDALTMHDIAAASELSKATLYLYFRNKDAILMEILEDAASVFVDYTQSRIPEGSTGLQALHALWSSYLNLYGESQDVVVLTGIKNYIDPGFPLNGNGENGKFGVAMGEMLELIAGVLRLGMADGSLERGREPEKLARTVIMIATSIIDTVTRIPRPQRDPRRISVEMRETFEIILRGLAADGAAPSLLKLTTK
ncbi:MAG TPA: TetR/AcrR family transcriptional regulator [Rectinemataceae bacterium]|nr:TetR/AcrR family transcriptional regulator [Rectinemataceae bacterium]